MKSLIRILLIGFMICTGEAFGQVTDAEYFFDDDPGVGYGTSIAITPSASLDGSFSADVTGLAPGFHRLFVRVKDDANNWGLFEGRTFYVQDNSAEAQPTEVASAEYFFDTDPGEGNGTAITITPGDNLEIAFDADASGLTAGFHRLFVRVKDDLGLWSLFEGRTLYIQETASGSSATQVSAAEYFFDDDPGVGQGTTLDLTTPAGDVNQQVSVNIADLASGFHKLFIRVQDDLGLWSLDEGRTFYVQAVSNESEATIVSAAEYFFDTDPGIGSGTAITLTASTAEIQENIELASTGLAEGTHTLFIRVEDDRGIWSIYQAADLTVTNGPLSNDGSVTTDEDVSLSFAEADFNYASSGGTDFTRVRINSLPLNGNLMLDGSGVSVDQEILVADLSILTYEPDTNVNGEDTFEFTVGDATDLSVSSSTMNIDVVAVNDAPAFTVSGDVTVEQDFTSTQTVTVTPATAPTDEADQVVSYSIDPATVTFADVSIDSGTGTVSITSVADEFGTQEFTITADDGGDANNTVSETFTLTVTPSNAAPIIADQSFDVDENSAQGTQIGTVTASDEEGDALTYTIISGNDAGGFSLDASLAVMTVSDESVLDFEINTSFGLTVEVSDGTSTATATITVNVTDINELPTIAAQSFEIEENTVQGTEVGVVVASDPDGDALTFSITAGNEAGGYTLDANTGVLSVNDATALDFETTTSFSLTVEASDGALSTSAIVTVNLIDVDDNQAPVIDAQTFSIDENSANGTSIGTVVATDGEGDELTYSITEGNTNDAFAIDVSSGLLTVADMNQLDFETTPSFTLTVQVADAELSSSAIVTINVNDVNENTAPIISAQTFSVDENSANGTSVGTVVATDGEGDELTYSITAGNSNDAFAIDGLSGLLTVADVNQLDFEATPSFTLTVQVADAELSSSAIVTVNLNDVNENTVPSVSSQTFSVDENSANGTSVGTVVASDGEGDELTYSITEGNTNDAFAIDASSGLLTVAEMNELDFETTPSFILTVQVADAELSASATITINLNDIDENILDVSKELEIEIYPNPATKFVTIQAEKRLPISVSDINGRELKRSYTNEIIDISDLSKGIYLIIIEDQTRKLIVY